MRWRSLLGLSIFALLAGPVSAADVIYLQAGDWSQHRYEYYSQDQGSRIMPLAWLQALKQPNGQPFLADSLGRYGYLSNPENSNGLPIGFTTTSGDGVTYAGMTCAACHTRQITYQGNAYRIDGGPGFGDFQGLMLGLDAAVAQVLCSDAAFQTFAAAVLQSPTPDPDDVVILRQQVDLWYLRHHTLVTLALPQSPQPAWGPGRLDAVGMIFNRLTGLDLGPPPSFIIAKNIKRADAPTRYPFLWNAPVQDKTQWPGFADNGGEFLGLTRNLGEEFGVFGDFQPTTAPPDHSFNFYSKNSANFKGLLKLEQLIGQIPPPLWPWGTDQKHVDDGKKIYQRPKEQGGCAECHWIDKIPAGPVRFPDVQTWETRIIDVGTDTREYDIMGWEANTGALQDAQLPGLAPLKPRDLAFNILKMSVLGSIIANVPALIGAGLHDSPGAFRPPAVTSRGAYESRVLQGIWAAAPYLHNGSVPSLTELLKSPKDRVSEFKVGPAYDKDNVGLAVEQPQSNYTFKTTGCGDGNSGRNSGNSNCGHDYGTQLKPDEKQKLLEFLKTL